MDRILEELQKFNFSKIEAAVYVTLVKSPEKNGSQIAKILNLPRTSVYTALENLYEKGAVYLIAGDSNVYIAEIPKKLLRKLKDELVVSAEFLEKEMEQYESFNTAEQYWNIKGQENFISKIKEMINEAKEEIYINTNYDISIFEDELKKAGEKNVRIILFSFEKIDLKDLKIEFYEGMIKEERKASPKFKGYKRMMLVSDNKKVFIASQKGENDIIGTFTENPLLVDIVAEHIHHDIYLMKIKKDLKADIEWSNIKLGTKIERLSC